MYTKKAFIIALFICYHTIEVSSTVVLLQDLIQFNVVGLPLIHKKENYEFDPDVSLRRRKQFEELHGVKGEKLIERIGLGIDGYADERLKKQHLRDEGHLGGLNYYLP